MGRSFPGQDTTEKSDRELRIRKLARKAAAEGMVLLENDGILPIARETRIALFGQGAKHTVKGGTGSGDVNARDVVTIYDGLRAAGCRIVNEDYLNRYEEAYREAEEKWKQEIYLAAGSEKDPVKFYQAHAELSPKKPDISITENDIAYAEIVIYVLSRISGEAVDRREEKGDYYLSDLEEKELRQLAGFPLPLVVLLNTCGVMDLSFLEAIPVNALLLISQAGCEGGNAAADVLTGAVDPCGKLTDSWTYHYDDYPSSQTFGKRNQNLIEEYYTEGIYVGYRYFDSFGIDVRYPFGYGGSYTAFSFETITFQQTDVGISCRVKVRNTGRTAGKQVVQIYVSCPSGVLMTEQKRLVAFQKTRLLKSGDEQSLELTFSLRQLGVYEEGRAAWLLQSGTYQVMLGENAEDYTLMGIMHLDHDVIIEQLSNVCEQTDALKELLPPKTLKTKRNRTGSSCTVLQTDSTCAAVLNITGLCERLSELEEAAEHAGQRYLAAWEAAVRTAAAMPDEEKACLVVGARNFLSTESVGAAAGSVPGAAGETTAFPAYQIPSMVLADGPAGIRVQQQYEVNTITNEIYGTESLFETYENRFFGKLKHHKSAKPYYQFATAFPVVTLLAQTFDPELAERVGEAIAEGMAAFGVQIWLGPGMNIHRNPLCGRNYEYYAEDPFLSGKMAAAITRGVQKDGTKGVCVKHFACNNQEDNRMHVTAVISERALREIYLKGFEIAVKEGNPVSIMTSYNRINGIHTANSYDLCTTVARGEWKFAGFIMTDWTTTNGGGSSAAKCISAGNDLIMPGRDSDVQEIMDALNGKKQSKVTSDQLNGCAARIIYAARAAKKEN